MKLNRFTSLLLVAVLLVSAVGGAAAVGGTVNWGADAAPDITYSKTETKAVHNMSWGADNTALRTYEGNSGGTQVLNAKVNTSVANPVSFVPTDVEENDFGAFPHSKDVSALAASEWAVGGANSSKGSVSDTETAPGVDAVRFSTDGSMASGDAVTFTNSNFSIDADERKHYLIVGQDIATLDSGTTVEYRVIDEDGDTVTAQINTSMSSGSAFMANATGEGYIFQAQLGTLIEDGHLTTNGDGTFNNIEKVQIAVLNGDADVAVPMLNLDKMSPYDFGTTAVDGDDDDSEPGDATEEIVEKKTAGPIELTGLDTLGGWATDSSEALIHSLSVEMVETAGDQPDDNVYLNLTKTGDRYPGYHGKAVVAVRISEVDAYDLTPSNGVITTTQTVTSGRLMKVEYAEGVNGDEPVDQQFVEDATLSDITSTFGDSGKQVQIDSSMSAGDTNLLVFTFKVDESQYNALQNAGGAGGGGALSGGISSIPVIGGLVVAVLGVLRRFGG